MRRLSARILVNRVTLQRANPGSDADGGITQTPSLLAADVPCSIQPSEPVRDVATLERFGNVAQWNVTFARDPGLRIGDLILWNEPGHGANHTLVATGTANQGGRNSTWVTSAVERV